MSDVGQLTCRISLSGSAPPTPEAWSVNVVSTAASAYEIGVDGTITHVICDPLVGFTIPA